MTTYTKTDHATFEHINALQLAGYPQAAAAILADWKRTHTSVGIQYHPTPGSEAEREVIASYDRPGHNAGD